MPKIESLCERGIKVVFLNGEVREVSEQTFSRCLVSAAYLRLTEGACSHSELTVDIGATKAANKRV